MFTEQYLDKLIPHIEAIRHIEESKEDGDMFKSFLVAKLKQLTLRKMQNEERGAALPQPAPTARKIKVAAAPDAVE